jgi:NADPH2:quinone reductase
LRCDEVELGEPGPGELRVRQTAIGVNFNEINIRLGKGSFPPDDLPIILGREAAGIIEAVGPGVEGFHPGQRIAYGYGGFGAYAEARLLPAEKAVVLPSTIDDRTAAAMMVKGMTAQYLLCRAYRVAAGDAILVHAAAGGVGSILCQWARHLGATVIGCVGSEAKVEIARSRGCDHVLIYDRDRLARQVREITEGKGVRAVYDSIGQDSFESSLDSLGLCGHLVAFGDTSGEVKSVVPHLLMSKGSLTYTRTSMRHFTSTREDLEATAGELFAMVENGHVRIEVNQTYKLREAGRAHLDMQERRNTGSTILLP